jgi:hypothetical protein
MISWTAMVLHRQLAFSKIQPPDQVSETAEKFPAGQNMEKSLKL